MNISPRVALLNSDLQRPDPLLLIPRESKKLWLDKNENLDPDLAAVINNLLLGTPSSLLMTYPESGDLYRKIAKLISVEPNQLLLTPGSDGAIRMVFDAMIEKNDVVIYTDPTFAMYPVYAKIYGALAREIKYKRVENRLCIDPEELINMLSDQKPKLLCLPNPDSPTGSVIPPEFLKKILVECENLGTLLLIDEAYHPFYDWSAVPWCAESKNLVVVRTFAKAWGVAGLRVGYLVAHPDIANLLHKIKPMYEVGTLAINLISRLLDYSSEMKKSVARINDAKRYFSREMVALGFKVIPTEANFLHVAFGDLEATINDVLQERVYYRRTFNVECLAGYSRFTIGSMEVMEEVVDLIKKGTGNHAK